LHSISVFLGKINISKKITLFYFTCLIKGIALGRALWGASTFLTRNRLPDSKSGFANLPYLTFFGFP